MAKKASQPRPVRRDELPVAEITDHCRVYVDGVMQSDQQLHPATLDHVRELEARGHDAFVWLSLNEPTERHMHQIAEDFHIHELITEDAVAAHQRPKVERYDSQLFMVVRSIIYRDHETVKDARQIIESGEVQMLIGPNFIITIRHRTRLPGLESRLDDAEELASYGPMGIAWAMSDHLVDHYLRVVEVLSTEVDELEEEVFTPNTRIDIQTIYNLKREILEMRHAIDPLAPALRQLITGNEDLIGKQLRSYFRDVLDHEMQAKDQVASFDERLSSLIDAGVAIISLQQNSDMRAISAYVGMAAVPTLIAGVYGMNFDNMPELHTQHGYFVVVTLMIVIVLALWVAFKKMGWLDK